MAVGISLVENIVYYGPNPILYPKLGRLKEKDRVKIIWREDEWFYIEFFDGDYKKRGYVQDLFISYIIGNVLSVPLVSETKMTTDSGISYLGPLPNIYKRAGTVFEYEPLKVFNVTLGDYTFVEYTISNNQRKRAFVNNKIIDKNANSSIMNYVGSRLADFTNEACYGSGSFYRRHSLRGQCTWYCWGRAKEKCKKRLLLSYPNNAHNWLENSTAGFKAKHDSNTQPMKNSIACFKGGSFGHVVFVEDVDDTFVYYTEANANSNNIIDFSDGVLKAEPIEKFKKHLGKTIQGYIEL